MSANEKQTSNSTDQKAKRHRSPGFPIIPIDDAIARVRLIFQHDKRAFTTSEAILSHLGYKQQRSGTAGRVISAMKQYGLLDEKSGQFRVSDTGFKILHLPEDSEERAKLIKEAALSPPLFKKILAYYNGEVPSDAALKSHLILNEKFNPDSVEQFIRAFRRTIEIANPSPDDYNASEESDEAEQPLFGGTPMQQPTRPSTGLPSSEMQRAFLSGHAAANAVLNQGAPPLAAGDTALVFKISRDSEARVIFNGQVTQEAIEKLRTLLDVSKDTYPTKAELEQPKEKPDLPNDDLDELFPANKQ